MDSGLSLRMGRALKELLPAIAAAAPPRQYNPTTAIDLSTAQNEVLRPELLEFFKSIIENRVTSEVTSCAVRKIWDPTNGEQVFALPSPNGGDPQLREALASFFNHYSSPAHTIRPEHIVLTAGASDAIESVIHAVCDDGDSVLVPGPSWRKPSTPTVYP
jgi:aspartate/methionine/tyrosine aminotransferase